MHRVNSGEEFTKKAPNIIKCSVSKSFAQSLVHSYRRHTQPAQFGTMSNSIEYTRVSTDAELEGIFSLHHKNLFKNLSEEEKELEGFVTAEYNIDLLKMMHNISPSIIAKHGDDVVGYILVATKELYTHHALLDDLFDQVDKLTFNSKPIKDSKYVLCGQLCVAKGYRGQGIVQGMYEHFRRSLEGEFEYCITDVSSANPRSLKAHIKTGFQVIDSIKFNDITFDVILWDWSERDGASLTISL